MNSGLNTTGQGNLFSWSLKQRKMLKRRMGMFSAAVIMKIMLTRYLGLMDLPNDGPTLSRRKDRSGKKKKKKGEVIKTKPWKAHRGPKIFHQDQVKDFSSLQANNTENVRALGNDVHKTNKKPLKSRSSFTVHNTHSQLDPTATTSNPSATIVVATFQ
jgi:hypothetical protein